MKSLFQLSKIEVSWAVGDFIPHLVLLGSYLVPTRFLAPMVTSKMGPSVQYITSLGVQGMRGGA